MLKKKLWLVGALASGILSAQPRNEEILFRRHAIDLGASETCALADVDGDGKLDIISSDAWYRNPDWKKHPFRKLDFIGGYVDDLSDLSLDVDGDGRIDIVSATWFAKRLWWARNPARAPGFWKEDIIETGYPVEFAFLVDLDNDGKAAEVLPQFGDTAAPLAWYEARKGRFLKHVVDLKSRGHGIGAGDVNGDGRNDILTPEGWFEAPADPRAGEWKFHPEYKLGSTGFLHVLDINVDGRPDILTSLAHDYGILWLEQKPDHTWAKLVVDDTWSQAHALTVVDLNGDGRKDLLTGKRYMAHNGKDPGEREPLGIYWYEYRPSADRKTVEWIRHVIDYGGRAGGGMQMPVADIDGDGDLDFATAGKSGLFLFENLTHAAPRSRAKP